MTQALLPSLRSAGGRIVFMSSIAGLVASPFMGAYNASKFGLEGLADALRIELRPWKIPVVLVEPGAIDTDLWRGAVTTVTRSSRGCPRSTTRCTPLRSRPPGPRSHGWRKGAASVDNVTSVVVKALTARRPRARYLVGTDAKAQRALGAALPTRAFDVLVSRMLGGT